MAATEELGLEVFVEGWQRFERIMDDLDKSVDQTGKSMESTGSIAGGAFAVALGTIAVNAAMALGRALLDAGKAIVAFGTESVQMAADFQSQMAVLEIAASSTGLSFDELHDAALQVGGDTRLMGVSATGAADAMTGLFKAGLSNVEVFGDLDGYMAGTAELGGALAASINLAAATELDMVQASDLAAVALATFGGEMETEAERAEFINDAMNNMVQAADASVAEVSDLAAALTMVGPSAGAAGISIQDTNNALALLSTRGIAGTRAGTSLDAMFRSLTDTTPQAQEAMDALGISIFDLDGGMLPLVDIIGQFESALGTATDAEEAAAMGAIFTAQGMRGMKVLMGEGVEGWNAMSEATANAAGIQEQAAVRSQTYNAQMEALQGTIETLKIGIGEQFLPVAQEMVTWFAGMVEEHGPAIQEMFAAVGVVVTNVIQFLMGLIETGDPLNEFFLQLPEPLRAFIQFLQDDFMPVAAEVWSFIMEQVGVVVRWFQDNLPLISAEGERVKEVWLTIAEIAGVAWGVIKEVISGALEVILGLMKAGMQVAQGDWAAAWQTMRVVNVNIAQTILASIEALMEGVAGMMGTSMSEIRETWASNWEMLKIIVMDILNSAATAVTQGLEIIKFIIVDTLQKAATAAGQLIAIFRQVGTDLINGLIEGIKAAASRVAQAAQDVVTNAINSAKSALGIESPSRVFFDIGEDVGDGFIDGIMSKGQEVSDAVSDMFKVAGGLGGLGAAAGARMKRDTELTDRIAAMRKNLEAAIRERKRLKAQRVRRVGADRAPFTALDPAEQRALKHQIGLQEAIAEAEKEQVKRQEQLLALEKQRQDLAFLQQQMKLLDLIKEHGLDAGEILGGMELGIDASLEGIVTAMSAAMQAIVEQVNEELQISSPSEVFAQIGRRTMEGMARGVAQLAPMVQSQMRAVVRAPAMAAMGGASSTNTETVNNFNLTTQSTTRPGGLAMEFGAMEYAGARVSR